MADISGQVSQAAAPGALLRTVAEAQTQDPSKVQTDAQVGSPIRNLVQNPLESSIPSTTPRTLNVVGAQNPTPDYSGMHAMLSAAPVPPPHVAAQLIRAMMTPPGQGGVVAPQRPAVAPATNPSMGNAGVVAPQMPRPTAPSMAGVPSANPGNSSGGVNTASRPVNSVAGPNFSQNPFSNNPSASFRPTQQQSSAPQLHWNGLGNSSYLGGTIDNIGSAGEKLGSEAVDAGLHALSPFARFLSPAADIFSGLNLSDLITNRLGLGGWFNPRQAS